MLHSRVLRSMAKQRTAARPDSAVDAPHAPSTDDPHTAATPPRPPKTTQRPAAQPDLPEPFSIPATPRPCLAKKQKKQKAAPPPSPTLQPILPTDARSTPLEKPFRRQVPTAFERTIAPEVPEGAFPVFRQLCPDELVERWVLWTNKKRFIPLSTKAGYVEGPRQRRSRDHDWVPTTKGELYLFLGILVYMGVHPEPRLEMYWSHNLKGPKHSIPRFMSRDRFQLLKRRLCTWDPDVQQTTPWDRVESWSSLMQSVSIRLWQPASKVSVDEAMVRFAGRCVNTVHLPSKPIPVGYKVWVVAEAGYFLQWVWHSRGRGPVGLHVSQLVVDGVNLAPTQAVVAHLLDRLPSPTNKLSGYHVFMDNLFSCARLFEALRLRGIAATGTARTGRLTSRQLQQFKATEKTKDSLPWGTLFALSHLEYKRVRQFGFKDMNFVTGLSSYFDGHEDFPQKLRRQPTSTSTSAKTARKPFNGQPRKLLPIPKLIDEYNNHMNGVDVGDQLRAAFASQHRIRRGGWQALLYNFLFGKSQ